MPSLSVVIITFNEAANIERCIGSTAGLADEVLVVDSFSTDDTPAIARRLGARVVQRAWPGYAQQREWAAQEAAHDLVLALDADEYLSSELHAAILPIKNLSSADAYTFNRLNRIGEYWVRHGGWYPDRKLRLFDRRKVTFHDAGGHDSIVPVPGATTGHLPGHLLHHSNPDLHDRLAQINKLSLDSALYLYRSGRKASWPGLFFKPPVRFFKEYFLRLGFLDGFYGLALACSSAQYVFWREYKIMELQRKTKDAGAS
jgi:glycosyltransferase involved in cell wall biosynthesis